MPYHFWQTEPPMQEAGWHVCYSKSMGNIYAGVGKSIALNSEPGNRPEDYFHTTQNPGTGQTIVTSQQNRQL
jgi:hypothetical protein